MNLEEALARIEELEAEAVEADADYQTELDEKDKEIRQLKNEVSELEDENRDLTKAQQRLDELEESVAIFRDPSNWNGDRFLPVLTYLRGDSPWELLN